MPTLRIVWRANADAKMCQRCASLDGYEWMFIDEEPPSMLYHPQLGPVWDLITDQSRAHGYGQFNCRCELEIFIDDTDLLEQLDLLDAETMRLDTTLEGGLGALNSFIDLLEGLL